MERNQEKALVTFGIEPENLIHKDGRYWMTAEVLGKALGYNHPAKAISNLYNRNKEELMPYCSTLKMRTPSAKDGRGGGLQNTTIFNTDGQWIISLLAKTAKAAKLRKFVIAMLKALEKRELVPAGKIDEARAEGMKKGYILNSMLSAYGLTMPVLARYCHFRKSGLTQKEIGVVFNLSLHQVQTLESNLRKMGIRFAPVISNKRDKIAKDHFMENISDITKEVQP
jgi:prophage antirepressor-like protein